MNNFSYSDDIQELSSASFFKGREHYKDAEVWASCTGEKILELASELGVTLGTAESLTAGQLGAQLGEVAGISDVFQGGVIAYQNEVKHHLLGVDENILNTRGAVDGHVALQMAWGVNSVVKSQLGISTTGVAGPGPHEGKLPGTVYIGVNYRQGQESFRSISGVLSEKNQNVTTKNACSLKASSDLREDTQIEFSKVFHNRYYGDRHEVRTHVMLDCLLIIVDTLEGIKTFGV